VFWHVGCWFGGVAEVGTVDGRGSFPLPMKPPTVFEVLQCCAELRVFLGVFGGEGLVGGVAVGRVVGLRGIFTK